jgi:hypothetical protein
MPHAVMMACLELEQNMNNFVRLSPIAWRAEVEQACVNRDLSGVGAREICNPIECYCFENIKYANRIACFGGRVAG